MNTISLVKHVASRLSLSLIGLLLFSNQVHSALDTDCQSDARPNILACFEAHGTDLMPFHYSQLDAIVKRVKRSHSTQKPIVFIDVIGHAATWKPGNISKVEYQRRSIVRAENVRAELRSRLKQAGVKPRRVTLITKSYGDTTPLIQDNKVSANRAINRRVELNLVRSSIKPVEPKDCEIGKKVLTAPVLSSADTRAERKRLESMRTFLAKGLCGKKVDGRFLRFQLYDGLGRTRSCKYEGSVNGVTREIKNPDVVKILAKRIKVDSSDRKVAKEIIKVYDDLYCEFNQLLMYLNQEKDNTGNLEDSFECVWALELLAASQRRKPQSIYHIFNPLLKKTTKYCLR